MSETNNVEITKGKSITYPGFMLISESVSSIDDVISIVSNIPGKLSDILHVDTDDIDDFFMLSIPEKFYETIKADLCIDGFPKIVEDITVSEPVLLKAFPQVHVISATKSEVNFFMIKDPNVMTPTDSYKKNLGETARIFMKQKIRNHAKSGQSFAIFIHPCFKAYFTDYYDGYIKMGDEFNGYYDVAKMKDKYADIVSIYFKYDLPSVEFVISDIDENGEMKNSKHIRDSFM